LKGNEVSNAETIKDLDNARAVFLREALAIMVRNHGPQDIISALSTVMDAYAVVYARKTGDYDGATAMRLVAAELDTIEERLDNHDGAPLQ
jgi:hypothetical protein